MEFHNNQEMTLGNRIKLARAARKMSRPQLSQKSGVKYPTLSGIENDDQSSTTYLPDIARALEVNLDWLRTGKGPRDLAESESEWSEIQGWKQHLAAGDGSEPLEFSETEKLKIHVEGLQKRGLSPQNLSVFYASGDSMNPRIHDGDALLLDCSHTEPQDDKIFALNYDGHLYVKRLRKFGKQWFLVSDNATGKWKDPIPVDDNKTFKILGRVRWIGSWEN